MKIYNFNNINIVNLDRTNLLSDYMSDDVWEMLDYYYDELRDYLMLVNPDDVYEIIHKYNKKYIFLIFDTNLLLDIVWNRNTNITKMYKRLIDKKYYLVNDGEIILSTTIVNVVELFDISRRYSTALALYELGISPDVVIKAYQGSDLPKKYEDMNFKRLSYKKGYRFLKKIFKALTNFWILYPDAKPYIEDVIILRDLIFRENIRDKDAMIAWVVSSYSDLLDVLENIEGFYILTTDKKFAKSEILRDLVYVYNLRDKKKFEEFINYVLKNWIDIDMGSD